MLVDAARRDELVDALQGELRRRYGAFDLPRDYTRIINAQQYQRLRGYLDDARARGLTVIEPFADSTQAQAAAMEAEQRRLAAARAMEFQHAESAGFGAEPPALPGAGPAREAVAGLSTAQVSAQFAQLLGSLRQRSAA